MSPAPYINSVIEARLRSCFEARSWDALTEYLSTLTVRDFRRACEILSRSVMTRCADDAYWSAFRQLAAWNSKAFLVTMLKAVPERKRQMGFSLRSAGYAAVADWLCSDGTATDRDKFARFMTNVFADDPDELVILFRSLNIDSPQGRMRFLIQGNGAGCYYLLFLDMRRCDHDPVLLTRCCRALMRKGDALSFNLASAAKEYFDLPDVRGTFSLRIEPYGLSRLELSYEDFKKMLGAAL